MPGKLGIPFAVEQQRSGAAQHRGPVVGEKQSEGGTLPGGGGEEQKQSPHRQDASQKQGRFPQQVVSAQTQGHQLNTDSSAETKQCIHCRGKVGGSKTLESHQIQAHTEAEPQDDHIHLPHDTHLPERVEKVSDEEKTEGNEQLSQIVEGQIGDAHGEFLLRPKGIENQDDVRKGEQHGTNGMHPCGSGGIADHIARCNGGHQNNGADVEDTEDFESQFHSEGFEDPGQQSGCNQNAQNQAGQQIAGQGNQCSQVENVTGEECGHTGQKDFLTDFGEDKAQVQQNVSQSAEAESDADQPGKGCVLRIAKGGKTDETEEQGCGAFQYHRFGVLFLMFDDDKADLAQNAQQCNVKYAHNHTVLSLLQHGGTAGNDPGSHSGHSEGTGIDIAGTAVAVGTKQAEYQHLGNEHNQDAHEGAAEGGAEEQVCTGADSHEEGNVLNEDNHQHTTDHQQGRAPPTAEEAFPTGLVSGDSAHVGKNFAVVQQEEQGKNGEIHKELSQSGEGKGLEEGPDEPEVQQEQLGADAYQHIHQTYHAGSQGSACAAQRPVNTLTAGGSKTEIAPYGPALFLCFFQTHAGGEEHNDHQQQVPAYKAVADGHAENFLGQREQSVTQLGHEGVGAAGKQQCNGGIFLPALFGQNSLFPGKGHSSLAEEGKHQQQLHKGQHGCDGQQHGSKYQQLFYHVSVLCGSQFGIKIQGVVKPYQRNGHAIFVMGCQTVVGFQQFHSPGSAVGKIAEGGVPGGFSRGAAKKLCPKVTVKDFVVYKVLVIPKIAELVILGLQQQNIIEVDIVRIIGTFAEKLTALQHRGLGRDVHPIGIYRTGVGSCHRPAGPGTHGMSA